MLVYTIGNSIDAGWSSLVARRAHNPKVVGSNPAPATILRFILKFILCLCKDKVFVWQVIDLRPPTCFVGFFVSVFFIYDG